MRIRIYVCVVLLWSSSCFSDEASINVLDLDATGALSSLPKVYSFENNDSVVIVKNMPRIRSQDSFNSCYGCSSATIVQKYFCDNHPNYKDKNCANISPELEVSQFDLVSKSLTNVDGQSTDMPRNHTNLRMKDSDIKKTAGVFALLNSQSIFSFNSEKCFPFDKLVEKYGDKSGAIVSQLLASVENKYNIKKSEGSANCTECLKEIQSGLNTDLSMDQLNSAFKKNTFGEFLYAVLFDKACTSKVELRNGPTVRMFPKINEPSEKKDLLKKLQSALGTKEKNKPVLLGNVCLYINKTTKECLTHSLVISGYKLMCKTSDKSEPENCKPALKVQNCWGEDWQNKNNDGWVDAEKLLSNVNRDLDKLNDGVLSWLE